MDAVEPVYLKTVRENLLSHKAARAAEILTNCTICPRRCEVDRTSAERGVCKTGGEAEVSSYSPHYGEEAPLVGDGGSGTIFFTHCNLMCVFCQNYEISHGGMGRETPSGKLAEMMLSLQEAGCHNINFVTPSHVVPQILSAVETAVGGGLRIPLVYNSSAYDSVDTLKLLEGVVDIYMPDFKFWDGELAWAACQARDYPEVAREAIREMHRQVGDLVVDDAGVARRGLLIRHLVLPRGAAGTAEIMRFIAREISTDTYVNIMAQYRPCGRAREVEVLAGRPSSTDFQQALRAAGEAGLTRLDQPRRVLMFR